MNHATRNALQSIPVRRNYLTKAVNLSEENIHRWWLFSGNYSADLWICIYIVENDPFQKHNRDAGMNQIQHL